MNTRHGSFIGQAARARCVILILLTLAMSGCERMHPHGHDIDPGDLIALRAAPSRKLVIVNQTTHELTLLPAPDAGNQPVKRIAPNEEFAVEFDLAEVVRAGQTVKSPRGYWFDGEGARTTVLHANDAARYLESAPGSDAVMRMRVPQEEDPWEFRIKLGPCLFGQMPAGGYRLVVSERPSEFDPPVELCEEDEE